MRYGLYEARSLLNDKTAYVLLDQDAAARRRFAVVYTALLRVRNRVGGLTRERVDAALRHVGDMGED